jgi:hypothetical protein
MTETWNEIRQLRIERDKLRAEIERLRAEVKQLQDVIVQQARNRDNGYAKRDDEIERLRAEALSHGNVMGRIAIAAFGDLNNRSDEECVAAVAELGYGLAGCRERVEQLRNAAGFAFRALNSYRVMYPSRRTHALDDARTKLQEALGDG